MSSMGCVIVQLSYKHCKNATNVRPQRPINTTNDVSAQKHNQPERLINGTNAVNATKVQPKHSINNTNAVNATKHSAPTRHEKIIKATKEL